MVLFFSSSREGNFKIKPAGIFTREKADSL